MAYGKQVLLALGLCALITFCPHVEADQLDEIQDSAVLNKINRDNFENRMNTASSWLPPERNLSRIFSQLQGPQLLHSWVSIPSTAFRTVREFSKLYPEYAWARKQVMSSTKGGEYVVEAYVPHPRYEQMASSTLIPDMAALEPPVLEVEYSETHEIQGYKGELHQRKDKTCSILFKLTK
ncbi:MAG: hypothetical protein KDD62_09850, partial [Bdellovibrionales bacterium]|nr:hypothetical protein [Bdellovibrionales bacterium]